MELLSGWKTEFVNDGHTFMVLTKESGLHSADLSHIQCNMLASAHVPGLLELHVKEMDYKASLHYGISGLRMLAQGMKGEKIAMTDYYGLLLQAVSILDNCKLYMLKMSNFILDEKYIFYRDSLIGGRIYFTYLPLQDGGLNVASNEAERFLAFAMRLVTCVSSLEGIGIQRLVDFCGSGQFSYGALRTLLLELLEGRTGLAEVRDSPQDLQSSLSNPSRERDQRKIIGERGREAGGDRSNGNSGPAYMKIQGNSPAAGGRLKKPFQEDQRFAAAGRISSSTSIQEQEALPDSEHFPSKIRTYLCLGAALAASLVWKFLYLDRPGTVQLWISTALTVVIIAGAFGMVTGRLRIPFFKQETDSEELEAEDSSSRGNFSSAKVNWNEIFSGESLESHQHNVVSRQSVEDEPLIPPRQPIIRKNAEYEAEAKWRWNDAFLSSEKSSSLLGAAAGSERYEPNVEQVMDDRSLSESYYAELGGRTQLLSSRREATVLLGKDSLIEERGSVNGSLSRPSRYLERREGEHGIPERIELKPGSFIIGRSGEVAQYVETTVGVSRAHVEIMLQEDSCGLKDLGSKNGTLLRGEPMVPYKDYQLKPGDEFTIAAAIYKLC
ncbi:hypothetical protein DCC85_06135 [Paenibacillus sp. CAA11]|uniref:DUF6382 domain-containing protein n=1 Tax=Paenibacillus sp. CAA11 TaxID=1532905 RepID=UPI000D38BF85|nr:DUF6382 domain-containing protein [Paenibacillus sp. CAA11]AWB43840.1 hypothetical protein DCC85_06135 [Paenibacillus sp. CAA11]